MDIKRAEMIDHLKAVYGDLPTADRINIYHNYRGIYGVLNDFATLEELEKTHLNDIETLEILNENLKRLYNKLK